MALPNARSPIRQHAWRLAIFLPATLIALAGIRWLRLSQATMYLGDLNPAGTAFITFEVEELGRIEQTGVSIRDAETGRVVADLSAYNWSRRQPLKWSSDGTKLVGVVTDGSPPERSRILVIEPFPSLRVIHDWEIPAPAPLVVYFDQLDRAVFVRSPPNVESNRPRLEIIADNSKIVRTIEYGKDEQPHGFMARDGKTINIGFYPDRAAGPNGDYVFTDGKQRALLRLDSGTGGQVCLVRGNTINTLYGSSQLVAIHNAKAKVNEIFKIGDLTTPIASLPQADMPTVFLDETQVIARDYSPNAVSVYDLRTGAKRLLSLQDVGQIAPTAGGHAMITNYQATLLHLNVETGATKELVNLRAGMRLYQTIAIVGIPLLWSLWMYLGFRFRTAYPFFDMLLLCFTTMLIAMCWSVFGLKEFFPNRGPVLFGCIMLGTTILLSVIWASTLKSMWGVAIPGGIVGAAAILGIMLIWTQGNSYRVVEGMIGGVATIFWQLIGLTLFRRWFGVLTKITSADTHGAEAKPSQLTLRQALVATGAFGLLFALMQFIDFGAFRFPGSKLFFVWLFTFTSVIAVSSLVAMWAAFRFPNPFTSSLLYVIAVSAYATCHYVGTRSWDLQLLWSVPVQYGLPVAAGGIVWLALRYCRARGYGLQKRQLALSS